MLKSIVISDLSIILYLRVHDSFLFKSTEEDVHRVDFTPQVPIVLAIITPSQVAETGSHICTCGKKKDVYVT